MGATSVFIYTKNRDNAYYSSALLEPLAIILKMHASK